MISDVAQDLSVEASRMALNFVRLLRPHRVAGVPKIRVGHMYDGGYVMLDAFAGIEAAYSVGISDDVSWDLDIAARGIQLRQYDHTIAALPVEHALFNWEKLGVGWRPEPDRSLDTIPNLLERNGHSASTGLLLKCDIEGIEWEVLSRLPSRVLGQFQQIVIEVHAQHKLRHMAFAQVACAALRNLALTHRVVHVHGNNFAPFVVVGGVPLPDVMELTFARLDLGAFSVSDEVFPGPLDMPCHSREADLYLGRFAFD